ncbi:MAG: DUF2796 domain-containing protein [Pseudomonadota bacterium]
MKKELGIAASLLSLCAAPALAGSEKRELGAHEHGHSALNIAIEGDRIEMELIAPGADIVGFEHEAKSDEDMAAVEQAKATLGEPLSLFGFSADAGCSVESASVEIEAEEHHDHHGDEAHAHDEHEHEHEHGGEAHAHAEDKHDHDHDEHAEHDHDEHDHGDEAAHNEFHAAYSLTCGAPDGLDSLDLAAFFDSFAGAEEVEVTVISDKGQSSYEVERVATAVDLQGIM